MVQVFLIRERTQNYVTVPNYPMDILSSSWAGSGKTQRVFTATYMYLIICAREKNIGKCHGGRKYEMRRKKESVKDKGRLGKEKRKMESTKAKRAEIKAKGTSASPIGTILILRREGGWFSDQYIDPRGKLLPHDGASLLLQRCPPARLTV
jgi:hypothetical protein